VHPPFRLLGRVLGRSGRTTSARVGSSRTRLPAFGLGSRLFIATLCWDDCWSVGRVVVEAMWTTTGAFQRSLSGRAGQAFVQDGEPVAMSETLLPVAVNIVGRESVDFLADCCTVAPYSD
jgi:hypothetical protein